MRALLSYSWSTVKSERFAASTVRCCASRLRSFCDISNSSETGGGDLTKSNTSNSVVMRALELSQSNKRFENKEKTQSLMEAFKRHPLDTGTPEVQIAAMTSRISCISKHLESNRKDKHSRRGLMMLLGKRQKMLNYLKDKSPERYMRLIEALGIAKKKKTERAREPFLDDLLAKLDMTEG